MGRVLGCGAGSLGSQWRHLPPPSLRDPRHRGDVAVDGLHQQGHLGGIRPVYTSSRGRQLGFHPDGLGEVTPTRLASRETSSSLAARLHLTVLVSPLVRQRDFDTCRNANNIKNETLRAKKAIYEHTLSRQIGS